MTSFTDCLSVWCEIMGRGALLYFGAMLGRLFLKQIRDLVVMLVAKLRNRRR